MALDNRRSIRYSRTAATNNYGTNSFCFPATSLSSAHTSYYELLHVKEVADNGRDTYTVGGGDG